MRWLVSDDAPWLTVTAAGKGDGTIEATTDCKGLKKGTYVAHAYVATRNDLDLVTLLLRVP